MDLRFEDHADFQRGAVWCAAGGAALATLGSLPLAVAGSALALTLGCAAGPWRPRIVAAGACAAAALAWALAPHPWSAPACGAVLGLLFAAARAEAARRSGALPPSRLAVALAITSAVAVLGLKEPVIGTRMTTTNENLNPRPVDSPYIYTVVGVVKDFHFQDLHTRIAPIVLFYNPDWRWKMYVKTTAKDASKAIAAVAKLWKQYNPEYPLNYTFLDDSFNELYKSDLRVGKLFNGFALIAILISCLGLGLILNSTNLRLLELEKLVCKRLATASRQSSR